MIEFCKAFKTSDGETHASLEDAKLHELMLICGEATTDQEDVFRKRFARLVMENSECIVDILTTTATSKPRARRLNGGTKTRKPKATPPPAA